MSIKQSSMLDDLCLNLGELSLGLYKRGIPLPKGVVFDLRQIDVHSNGSTLNFFASPLTHWNDGSLKWVLIGFSLNETASVELIVNQSTNQNDSALPSNKLTKQTNKGYEVHCSSKLSVHHFIDTQQLQVQFDGQSLFDVELELAVDKQSRVPLSPVTVESEEYFNPHTGDCVAIDLSVYSDVSVEGLKAPIKFLQKWQWFVEKPEITLDVSIHNPNPAVHPDGLWDLGDPGSFLFSSLSIQVRNAEETKHQLKVSSGQDWEVVDEKATVVQHSSGGENWNSPVHLDSSNNVSLAHQGYTVSIDDQPVDTGLRASPQMKALFDGGSYSIGFEGFWQSFPSALSFDSGSVKLSLFPEQERLHELQGGEKSTQRVLIAIGDHTAPELSQINSFSIPENWIEKTKVHRGLVASLTANNSALASLIQEGLDGKSSFYKKREQLDEYGWRNFGDLYADHETAGYDGDDIFVSHYNNQYDPLMGFLKQYITTGDTRWFDLANDLAKHIKDIDIYNTDLDKYEYNGGLFWHTDHYVKACTSSHRSFSKYQDKDVYMDHAGGGGPGGQHCYTTGLAMHYLLTGDESSQLAVLQLSNWIGNFYDGKGTLFEWLLALKNRAVPGLKDHFNEKYPLDRGTGNYIVALIDSYEVTANTDYLNKAFDVIHHTISPNDDVGQLNLHDVENAWFYTVLLQAVYRYLLVKESREEIDADFYYARDALLLFADWMVENEAPYLNTPDILEYPNDTWAAQDLRKACVFAAAYYYSNGHSMVLREKAIEFKEYVENKLKDSDERVYTRILAILMQNFGVTEFFLENASSVSFNKDRMSEMSPGYKQRSLASGAFTNLLKRICSFSPKEELNWLRIRLGK